MSSWLRLAPDHNSLLSASAHTTLVAESILRGSLRKGGCIDGLHPTSPGTPMSATHRIRNVAGACLSALAPVLAGCAEITPYQKIDAALCGSGELPPVPASAGGSGPIMISANKSSNGGLTSTGLGGVAAHIHQGARGQHGPIPVGLMKVRENVWYVPVGEAQ